MSNLVDLVRGIVDSIDLNLDVNNIDGDKVYLCNTKHLTVGSIVKDELGNEYTVTAISLNEWVEVISFEGVMFTGELLVSPPITFLHGSPNSTNNEYHNLAQLTSDKTPFIWLLGGWEYTKPSRSSAFKAKYNARLFFMGWYSLKRDLNDQHNELLIKPMANLVDEFIDSANAMQGLQTIEDVTITERTRFDSKKDKKIINEDLSGIDLKIKLNIYDFNLCSCKK